MVLKNLDIGDVFPQQHKNAHVPPHENTKMARERDCVSSSHPHRAWNNPGRQYRKKGYTKEKARQAYTTARSVKMTALLDGRNFGRKVSDPMMTYVRKCKRRSHSVASRLCACAREDSTA